MGHDVLEVQIIIIGQGGSLPSESVKPMLCERDNNVSQNFPKAISEGSVNNGMEGWEVMNKKGGVERGLDCISFWRARTSHKVGLVRSGIWTK